MANESVVNETKPIADPPKRSGVEGIKENSRGLRGDIASVLQGDTDHFAEAEKQLLKFHGSYQQEDRDARQERRKQGLGKYYMFMVRCKIPGGKLTTEQYLAIDDIAEQYANGTLRITSRQGIQLHGVLKSNLKNTIAGINECLLSTLGACGDVNRNVMVCPAPLKDGLHEQMQQIGEELAARFAPKSGAYHEIWLNGKSVPVIDEPDLEPIYGKVYLPRKFKIGVALPENNLIDIYAQDLGLLAIVEKGNIKGYNVLVGGGMGRTHGKPETFPHLAQPICYVPAKEVAAAAEAVIKLFRDHGNRENRKRARIKYLVHDWGVEKFRDVLSGYVDKPLKDPKPVKATGFDLALGWHPQGDGKFWYGVGVLSGRIKDDGDFRLRSALRKIMEKFEPEVRLTPMQDILLCNLKEKARGEIEKILKKHGVKLPGKLPLLQQLTMSCPAIPTCGLAISESERCMPELIETLNAELQRLDLDKDEISLRATGCPNGCARPYQCDIGVVGRSGTKYALFVGGNVIGDRLNFLLRDLTPFEEIVPTLKPLLEDYRANRKAKEGFGDYCHRLGLDTLTALLPEKWRAPQSKKPASTPNYRIHDEAGAPKVVNGALKKSTPATKTDAVKEVEIYLTGLAGEEIADYRHNYDDNGNIRETVIHFYGNNRRAKDVPAATGLARDEVYQGQVDPTNPAAGKKLRDIHYTGAKGQELIDKIEKYDGATTRTVIYFYEGNRRAADAVNGVPIRKQVVYKGEEVV